MASVQCHSSTLVESGDSSSAPLLSSPATGPRFPFGLRTTSNANSPLSCHHQESSEYDKSSKILLDSSPPDLLHNSLDHFKREISAKAPSNDSVALRFDSMTDQQADHSTFSRQASPDGSPVAPIEASDHCTDVFTDYLDHRLREVLQMRQDRGHDDFPSRSTDTPYQESLNSVQSEIVCSQVPDSSFRSTERQTHALSSPSYAYNSGVKLGDKSLRHSQDTKDSYSHSETVTHDDRTDVITVKSKTGIDSRAPQVSESRQSFRTSVSNDERDANNSRNSKAAQHSGSSTVTLDINGPMAAKRKREIFTGPLLGHTPSQYAGPRLVC
jgi:hypothetical protein